MNSAKEKLKKLVPLFVAAVGVVFVVVCILGINRVKTYLPAKGKIVSIDVDYGAGEDDTTTYKVMVEYEIDGTTYYSELGEMKSGFHVGKEIDILYDPVTKTDIALKGSPGNYIGIAVGALIAVVGVFTFIRGKKEGVPEAY